MELSVENNHANPYIGPRTFTSSDSHRFFGRDREARNLVSLVVAEPLVLFHARSGAGKSSLLNTRLIPALTDRGLYVFPVGRVGGALPPDNVEVGNVFVYSLLLSLEGEDADPAALAQMSIAAYLQSKQSLTSQTTGHVLIIDQFEEIMTTHRANWSDREKFFAQLGQALWQDPSLWVVLVSREDYVASYEPYVHYLPSRLRNRYHMQRLEIDAARQALDLAICHEWEPVCEI